MANNVPSGQVVGWMLDYACHQNLYPLIKICNSLLRDYKHEFKASERCEQNLLLCAFTNVIQNRGDFERMEPTDVLELFLMLLPERKKPKYKKVAARVCMEIKRQVFLVRLSRRSASKDEMIELLETLFPPEDHHQGNKRRRGGQDGATAFFNKYQKMIGVVPHSIEQKTKMELFELLYLAYGRLSSSFSGMFDVYMEKHAYNRFQKLVTAFLKSFIRPSLTPYIVEREIKGGSVPSLSSSPGGKEEERGEVETRIGAASKRRRNSAMTKTTTSASVFKEQQQQQKVRRRGRKRRKIEEQEQKEEEGEEEEEGEDDDDEEERKEEEEEEEEREKKVSEDEEYEQESEYNPSDDDEEEEEEEEEEEDDNDLEDMEYGIYRRRSSRRSSRRNSNHRSYRENRRYISRTRRANHQAKRRKDRHQQQEHNKRKKGAREVIMIDEEEDEEENEGGRQDTEEEKGEYSDDDEDEKEEDDSDEVILSTCDLRAGELVAVPSADNEDGTPFWVAKIIKINQHGAKVQWYDSDKAFGRYTPCYSDKRKKEPWIQRIPNRTTVITSGFRLNRTGYLSKKTSATIKAHRMVRDFTKMSEEEGSEEGDGKVSQVY